MRPRDFLRKQFRLYRLWILERPGDAALSAPDAPPGIDLHFLDRHERRDWVCEFASDDDWPQFRAALKHDHDLVLARRGDKTLGWAWIGYENVFLPPLGREIGLPAGTAYLYEAFVRPGERGHGVGKALVAARCAHALDRGFERLLTHVVYGNQASMRALAAHGFVVKGRTQFLKALALRFWIRSPLGEAQGAHG